MAASSRIRIELTFNNLYDLTTDLSTESLAIPEHQREYCWTNLKAQKFIGSILEGLPTPSILLREERGSAPMLEDGRQRLTTMLRFFNDEILTEDGKKFSDLSETQKVQTRSYKISIVKYYNATTEQAIEIFDRFQNGVPLTVGERYYSLSAISPLVRYTRSTLLTSGQGLHDMFVPVWGSRCGRDPRRHYLKNAVAMIAGLAFGSGAITQKWDEVQNLRILSRSFDEAAVTNNLRLVHQIYTEVQRRSPMQGRKALNDQWAVGKITGYIIYSLLKYPGEQQRLITGWVNFLISAREDPSKLQTVLHVDDTAARFWSETRWKMGYLRVFDPEEAQRLATAESRSYNQEAEEDEDSESM
jgi:hypothetical protein